MSRRAWALFALMAVLWGIPYLFIKVAVSDVSPVFLVFTRTGLAALLLLPLALRTGALRGLCSRLGWVLLLAVMEVAAPFLLISFAEQRVPSSLSGLLVATEPLLVAVLALRVDSSERVAGSRLAGLVVGFAGVVLLLGLDVGPHAGSLVGAAMIVVATLGYAGGALLVKRRFTDVPPLGVATSAVTVTALLVLPAAVVTAPSRLPSPAAMGSLAVLGVACTAAGYIAFFSLIGLAGASRASLITYASPAVAVALGILVLGEPVTAAMIVGFLLILAGSWLSSGGRLPPADHAAWRRARKRRDGAMLAQRRRGLEPPRGAAQHD